MELDLTTEERTYRFRGTVTFHRGCPKGGGSAYVGDFFGERLYFSYDKPNDLDERVTLLGYLSSLVKAITFLSRTEYYKEGHGIVVEAKVLLTLLAPTGLDIISLAGEDGPSQLLLHLLHIDHVERSGETSVLSVLPYRECARDFHCTREKLPPANNNTSMSGAAASPVAAAHSWGNGGYLPQPPASSNGSGHPQFSAVIVGNHSPREHAEFFLSRMSAALGVPQLTNGVVVDELVKQLLALLDEHGVLDISEVSAGDLKQWRYVRKDVMVHNGKLIGSSDRVTWQLVGSSTAPAATEDRGELMRRAVIKRLAGKKAICEQYKGSRDERAQLLGAMIEQIEKLDLDQED